MVYARIAGTGQYLPPRIMTNSDLEEMMKKQFPNNPEKWTNDEWIFPRTGIKERRISEPHETNAFMGAPAFKMAMEDAAVKKENIDMLIVATNSNRKRFPSCAGQIAAMVDLPETCGIYDIQAGCTGFSYALDIADSYIRSGRYRTIGIVGTDQLSSITDYADRETCPLFGDLASAWILKAGENPGIIKSLMRGRGKDGHLITLKDDNDKLTMQGRSVFKFATEVLPQICLDVLKGTSYTLRAVKNIFPHNANVRIIDYSAQRLANETGIPEEEMKEKFYHTTEKYGNASAGSNANSFHEARMKGVVKPGDLCILVGFGAGLTYGANLFIL
jgi:3-oxoacyl-[acyl-carrier-protein] synthase-3